MIYGNWNLIRGIDNLKGFNPYLGFFFIRKGVSLCTGRED
jgi:hypothetical protein